MQNHVLDYLDDIVKKCPDKLAFANEKEGLTFKEVYEQTRSIGTYLHKQGIYKEPVIVFMNKHPKTITASLRADAFMCPLMSRCRWHESI